MKERLHVLNDWLAKTLFFPPIIAICHFLDRNQFYLARMIQMVGGLLNAVAIVIIFEWWSIIMLPLLEFRTLILMMIFTSRDREAIFSRERKLRNPDSDATLNLVLIGIHLAVLGFCISDPDTALVLLSIASHLMIWASFAYDLPELPPRQPRGKLAWQM